LPGGGRAEGDEVQEEVCGEVEEVGCVNEKKIVAGREATIFFCLA
jgi:hypothetical protein